MLIQGINKEDANAGEDDSSSEDELNEEEKAELSKFLIRSVKNAGMTKELNSIQVRPENNLLITSSENVAVVWEYDSLKFKGICVTDAPITNTKIIM